MDGMIALEEATLDAATKYATSRSNTFISMLRRDAQNINVPLLGDSTGNEVTEWFYLMITVLAGMFPRYTFRYSSWNEANQNYDAAVTLQTGTGPNVIHFYNGSVPGANVTYITDGGAARIAAMLPVQMHALIFSYGYNWPSLTSYREQEAYVINALLGYHPRAEVIVCCQPPLATTSTEGTANHLQRQDSIRAMAELEGWLIIDATQAFIDYGDYNVLIQSDLKHPTNVSPGGGQITGSQVWANEALRTLTKRPLTAQRPPRSTAPNHVWIPAKQFDIVAGVPSYGWVAGCESHTWAFDADTLEEVACTALIPNTWARVAVRLLWHCPANAGNVQWIVRTGRLSSWAGNLGGNTSNLTSIGSLQASAAGNVSVRSNLIYDGRDPAAAFNGRGVDGGIPAKFKITRDAANAGDSATGDAHLIGLLIERVS